MYGVTDAVRTLLTGPRIEIGYGAELLDSNDAVITDLGADFAGGTVKHNVTGTTPGTCDLKLLLPLDWGHARVRTYQLISDGHSAPVRFNQGVYVLAVPDDELGETPRTYSVLGFDKMHLLEPAICDSYAAAAGVTYKAAVAQVLTDAGVTGVLMLAGDGITKVLPEPYVWLDPADGTRWMDVANKLLDAVAYNPLYVDNEGRFRSEPYTLPTTRPPEWAFNLLDQSTNIVHPARTRTINAFDALNWWRFFQDGATAKPVEGAGMYTVDRSAGGVKRRAIERLTAADQATLVALGNKAVAEATQVIETLSISTDALPVLGHNDVVTYMDGSIGSLKALVKSWSMDLATGVTQIDLETIR